MKVLANDGLDKNAVETLLKNGIEVETTHYEQDELANIIKNYDVLIVRSATTANKEILDGAKNSDLKLIIRAGVGIDNIDMNCAKNYGIDVTNTPNSSSNSVAELVIGHMIGLSRFITISNITMRNGEWNKKKYIGVELQGKTLGIIGLGRIGKLVGQKAAALGMDIIYYDKFVKDYDEFTYFDLEEILKRADFLSVNVPALDKPLIGKKEIEIMKNGVFIINASRGGVVNEQDLIEALNTDKIAGVGLDVFIGEPNPNKVLCNHPKVSCTPHIGSATVEAQKRIGNEIVEIILELKKNIS